MQKTGILITGVLLFALLFASCTRDRRSLDERIHSALERRLGQFHVRGASAAVILGDGPVHCVVAGVSHDTVAIVPDMLFAIGSITKNMIAALVLALAEEDALSLDDPLQKWLPPYPYIDSMITVRQLLGHTSGIFMFWENQKLWDDLIMYRDSLFTPEVVLTYLDKPYFSPGKGFRYSNTNYLLLAKIITKVTGTPLSVQLRRRFWQPLGLAHAFLSMEDDIPKQQLAHVWGDNFEKGGIVKDITFLPRRAHETITYGSSGVFITAHDLALWCAALFRAGC